MALSAKSHLSKLINAVICLKKTDSERPVPSYSIPLHGKSLEEIEVQRINIRIDCCGKGVRNSSFVSDYKHIIITDCEVYLENDLFWKGE